ncbi:MAG: hypothetical protein AAFW87_02400 [Pseudomonadota bacterium]
MRRATSDLYYALFHRVCEALVQPIGLLPESTAFVETYRTLYRIPDHAFVAQRCKEVRSHSFSEAIASFGQQIVVMRTKREDADYDPMKRFAISVVNNDLSTVASVIKGFGKTDPVEQARFAYFVSLKGRKLKE